MTAQQTKKAKRFYTVLATVNAFFPVAEAVTLVWFNTILISNDAKPESAVLQWLTLCCKYGNAVAQLLSGTLLIIAVL